MPSCGRHTAILYLGNGWARSSSWHCLRLGMRRWFAFQYRLKLALVVAVGAQYSLYSQHFQ